MEVEFSLENARRFGVGRLEEKPKSQKLPLSKYKKMLSNVIYSLMFFFCCVFSFYASPPFDVKSFSEIVRNILIASESFHILAHLNVLLRISPPSLEYLKVRRWYFVWDMLSAILSYLYAGEYLWLLIPHALAHAFYVFFWNKGELAIRIRDWSAKEYTGQWITPDFYLTCFDIATHSSMVYALIYSHFNLSQIF